MMILVIGASAQSPPVARRSAVETECQEQLNSLAEQTRRLIENVAELRGEIRILRLELSINLVRLELAKYAELWAGVSEERSLLAKRLTHLMDDKSSATSAEDQERLDELLKEEREIVADFNRLDAEEENLSGQANSAKERLQKLQSELAKLSQASRLMESQAKPQQQ